MASIISAGTTTATALNMSADTSGVLQLASNNGTVAVTIDGSQNVGIGTTPSAGGLSTYRLLEIGTASNGSLYSGVNQMLIGTNIAWSGSTPNYKTGTYPPTLYNQQNGTHSWSYAAAGTAGNAITFTTGMTLNASGNLGLGTTPSGWDTGNSVKAIQLTQGAVWGYSSNNIYLASNYYWNGTNRIYSTTNAAAEYTIGSGAHFWTIATSGTAGTAITWPNPAMTLDTSGNLLVGTTTNNYTAAKGMVYAESAVSPYLAICHASGAATGSSYVVFSYNGNLIGNIVQNGTTGVLYNVMSDYRLKNNQEALTGAKDFIMALKPKKWQWWDGSGEGVGFVAHEFMEVAKYSGHGEKDAVETIEIKDEDGNVTGTEERPVYQSIQPSSSEVMANLVSLIQEQQALITQLQADVAALKGAA